MQNFTNSISQYLEYCLNQKRLSTNTIKAYRIDLKQFSEYMLLPDSPDNLKLLLESYIAFLHQQYKAKTAKRKIASVKAFFQFLEFQNLMVSNPFHTIKIRFRESTTLPKAIPLYHLESLLHAAYQHLISAHTDFQKNRALRDTAVMELLFATGMRISELCSLRVSDVDLTDGVILIFGKGKKERLIHIGNPDVLSILKRYQADFSFAIQTSQYFFVKPDGSPISDQMVRRMLCKYTAMASINQHITPHMFRHTFATSLLDAGVDIRFIQELLGHSSIHITEIYTHVAVGKQRDILTAKHPRKSMRV